MLERVSEFPTGARPDRCIVGETGVLFAGTGILWWPWDAQREQTWTKFGAGWRVTARGVVLAGGIAYVPHTQGARSAVVRVAVDGSAEPVAVELPGLGSLVPALVQSRPVRTQSDGVSHHSLTGLDPVTLAPQWTMPCPTKAVLAVGDVLVGVDRALFVTRNPEAGIWEEYPTNTPTRPMRVIESIVSGTELLLATANPNDTDRHILGSWNVDAREGMPWVELDRDEYLAAATPDRGVFLTRTSDANPGIVRKRDIARGGSVWSFHPPGQSGPEAVWTPRGIAVCSNTGQNNARLWLLSPDTGEILDSQELQNGAASKVFLAGAHVLTVNTQMFRAFRLS